jgi:hypothetical protein
MPVHRIPAADLRLGDEVELHKPDRLDPYMRLLGMEIEHWHIVNLEEGQRRDYYYDRLTYACLPTIIAAAIRMLAPDVIITKKFSFFSSHLLMVRRDDDEPESGSVGIVGANS